MGSLRANLTPSVIASLTHASALIPRLRAMEVPPSVIHRKQGMNVT